MGKYPCWAVLNEAGRQAWGDIFPSGQVPIKGIQTGLTELEGLGEREIRLVELAEFTEDQFNAITQRIADRNRPVELDPSLNAMWLERVRDEVRKVGLPIREEQIETILVKDPRRWF